MNRDGHREIRESLGAYALSALSEPESTAVRAHLDGCPACRTELAEIEPVVAPLRAVDPDRLDSTPAPPPWLGERIVARAVDEAPPTRSRSPVLVGAAAVVVAAVLAGGIGFVVGAGSATPDVPREPVALRVVDAGIDASATVVPHTWGMEITLVADGFRAGSAYRVVVVDDTGRQVDAGEFLGTGDSAMRCNLNSSVLRAGAAGFDVLAPDGAVVLHGEL